MDDHEIFIFNKNTSPHEFTWQKCASWRRFLRGCKHSQISLVASSHNTLVFTVDEHKWGVYLFSSNEETLDIIRSTPLMLSGFCAVTDGGRFFGEDVFARVLSLMGDFGIEIITDWNLDPLKRHYITMNCRRYSVRCSVQRPKGFNENARYFLLERD